MVGCVEGMGESGNLNWYFSKNLTTNKQTKVCCESVSFRNVREAISMMSYQHGCLNKA